MSQPRETYTYKCKNRGCTSSGTFEGAPPEWWTAKGLSEPSNCPECRDWKKSQGDERLTCQGCEAVKNVSARFKITHFTKVGPWNADKFLCRTCIDNPGMVFGILRHKEYKKTGKDFFSTGKKLPTGSFSKPVKYWGIDIEKELELLAGSPYTEANPVEVPTDPEYYLSLPDYTHGNALAHIIEGHGEDLAAVFGSSTPQSILHNLHQIVTSSNPDHIVEFVQPADGRVVKFDKTKGITVVLKPNEAPPPEQRILTAYPCKPSYVVGKLTEGLWQPVL